MEQRRSTRCARQCSQCDSVFSPIFNPTKVQSAMRWTTFPRFEEVEYPGGQCASFWPENAALVWRAARLPQGPCKEHHSSAEVDIVLRGGTLPQQRTSTSWRTAMLEALDKRVIAGQQQLTQVSLNSLLEHHDAASNSQACHTRGEACAPANAVVQAIEVVGHMGGSSVSAVYDKALSKTLRAGQRAVYLKMQRRRATRDAAAAAAAAANLVGLSTKSEDTAAGCSEAKEHEAVMLPGKTRCSLCLESTPDLIQPCKAESCGAVVCLPCWDRYLLLTIGVGTSRYACPAIPCFSCRVVLPTEKWASLSAGSKQLSVEYACRAAQLMTVNCGLCGRHTDTIFPQFDETEARSGGYLAAVGRACKSAGIKIEMDALREAEAAWLQYEHGAAAQLARQLLTLPIAPARLHMALCVVRDVERRLALQLALLSIEPNVSAGLIGCGCAGATCFKCKQNRRHCACSTSSLAVAGEAQGDRETHVETERDTQQSRQRCPSCAVPAPTHDPCCASVLCICGKYFETTHLIA